MRKFVFSLFVLCAACPSTDVASTTRSVPCPPSSNQYEVRCDAAGTCEYRFGETVRSCSAADSAGCASAIMAVTSACQGGATTDGGIVSPDSGTVNGPDANNLPDAAVVPNGQCASNVPCTNDSQCTALAGTSCNENNNLCQTVLCGTSGSPCNNDEHCAAGHICHRDFVCAAVGSPGTLADGSPCQNGAACRSGSCGNARVCGDFHGQNESCYDGSQCELGLACDFGVCRAPRAAGEACNNSPQCESSLVCNSRSSVCALPGQFPCREGRCNSGYACSNNTCEPVTCPLIANAACDIVTNAGCATGTRCYQTADDAVDCVDIGIFGVGEVGVSCTRGDQCRAGLICASGECAERCCSDAECSGGRTCVEAERLSHGFCLLRATCNWQTNEGCAAGRSCQYNEDHFYTCPPVGAAGIGAECAATNCVANAFCATLDNAARPVCVQKCQTNASTCPSGFVCVPLQRGTDGGCVPQQS